MHFGHDVMLILYDVKIHVVNNCVVASAPIYGFKNTHHWILFGLREYGLDSRGKYQFISKFGQHARNDLKSKL